LSTAWEAIVADHTPGPWKAERTQGWGGDICIIAGDGKKPIFKAVKPDAYYTDYMPGRSPGSVILSDDIAERNGRYVATKEIKAELDKIEEANARLIAAAPELLEALKWMVANDETNEGDEPLPERGGLSWNEINAYWVDGLNKARAAIAKAEGGDA
jgi:hypothetical protein